MSLPHAVIIAGGKGERLGGVRKGDLRIGGRRLLERVEEALGAVERPLLISTGPDERRGAVPDSIDMPDLDAPAGGPLAGLAAAVAILQARGIADGLLVSVAVDTPYLPADFVDVMTHALGDAPAAFAAWGEEFYPPNAIWRLDTLAALPAHVLADSAPHSLKALQQAMGARRVDWAKRQPINPFVNINTVADLVALGRRLRN